MTPDEWELQVPPQGATRHAISIEAMRRVFYTDTQAWGGLAWHDVGCTHSYSTPLDEEPFLKTTRKRNYYSSEATPIYTHRKGERD